MDRRKHPATLWLWCCILACVVASGDKEAFAQSPWEYIPNQPYIAQVVGFHHETLADGTRARRENKLVYMRDSQGRARIETFRMVNLYIPSQRQFIQLLVARKIARVMTFPGAGPIPTHGPPLNAVQTTVENLPGQTVNGIYAVGTRTTVRLPSDDGKGPGVVDVQESWVSPDLEIVVLSKHKSTAPGSDEATWEVQKLDRSEPDVALFEIPKDYKIVTATFDGSQADSPPESSSKGQSTSRP